MLIGSPPYKHCRKSEQKSFKCLFHKWEYKLIMDYSVSFSAANIGILWTATTGSPIFREIFNRILIKRSGPEVPERPEGFWTAPMSRQTAGKSNATAEQMMTLLSGVRKVQAGCPIPHRQTNRKNNLPEHKVSSCPHRHSLWQMYRHLPVSPSIYMMQ